MSTMEYYIAIKNNTVLNRKPGNEATCIWSLNLWQKRQGYIMGKRKPLQKTMSRKMDSFFDMLKSQTGLFLILCAKINSNELKTEIWDLKPKTSRGKHRQYYQYVFWSASSGKRNKSHSKQIGLDQTHGFLGGSGGRESSCSVGDLDSILGLGKSPGEGNGSPLQYSCLENSMNRGAWKATVHGVSKSQTWLSD